MAYFRLTVKMRKRDTVSDILNKITSIDPDDDIKEGQGPSPEKKSRSFLIPLEEDQDLNMPLQELPEDEFGSGFKWMKWLGFLAVLAWIGASFSYLYGLFDFGAKWTEFTPLQIAGLVLAILLPAILLAMLFYSLSKLALLTREARRLAKVSQELSTPDNSVIARTATMAQAVKKEIDIVDSRIDQALARMGVLEGVISDQTQHLTQTVSQTQTTTDHIASNLHTQKNALESIANLFDTKMAELSTTMTENSGKLERSTQLAEQKISEARVSVEGVAAKINAASDVVRKNSLEAAESLTGSQEEIDRLGSMLSQKSLELDGIYRKHAEDLARMIKQLNSEHESLTVEFENRLEKMRDMALSAKVGAESLTEASNVGRKTVEALAEAAKYTDSAVKQRFSEMENMVKFSSEKAERISDLATRRVQDSLSQTRREIGRIENDMAALQQRLAEKNFVIEPGETAAQIPEKSEEASEVPIAKPRKKGRSRLRFKPLEEDFPPVEPPRLPEQAETQSEMSDAGDALDDDTLQIEIEPVQLEQDLRQPDPNKDLTDFNTDDIVPASATVTEPVKKSGWRWRDMLGGLGQNEDPPITDEFVKPEPRGANAPVGMRVIDALTAIGLAPGAIVDDGCIIEAANTRRAKGALSMSQVVHNRLGDPVRHLHRALIDQPGLKEDAEQLVAQYRKRVGLIESDRESIRTILESEAGRAFLLCDAAING